MLKPSPMRGGPVGRELLRGPCGASGYACWLGGPRRFPLVSLLAGCGQQLKKLLTKFVDVVTFVGKLQQPEPFAELFELSRLLHKQFTHWYFAHVHLPFLDAASMVAVLALSMTACGGVPATLTKSD